MGVVVLGEAVGVMVRAGALVVVVVVGGKVVVVVVVECRFGFVVVGDDFADFVAPFSVGADPQLANSKAAIDTPMPMEIGLMEHNCSNACSNCSQRRSARPFGRKAPSKSATDVGWDSFEMVPHR